VNSKKAFLLNYTIQPILREIGLPWLDDTWGNDHVFKNKDGVIEGRSYPLCFNSKLESAETQSSNIISILCFDETRFGLSTMVLN
jgi:hypothetical protein